MIVPTGTGAEIGGYAGDATPASNLLASVCDSLIVNPNVVNGASLMEAAPNILYVEGSAIDMMMQKKICLEPVRSNRIGIIIDSWVKNKPQLLNPLLNAIDAMRTNSGIYISGYTFTEQEVRARAVLSSAGISQGEVDHPGEVLKSAKKLRADGAQAIAILCHIENPFSEKEDLYLRGQGIDPIGGIEAILSHLIVRELRIPAAHAPILDSFGLSEKADPRAAAEEISFSYVPCILKGLSRAPRLLPEESNKPGSLSVEDIEFLVLPQGALGGVPALEAFNRDIPVIVVKENTSCLQITPEKLNVQNRVIAAANYLEAAGILACMKAGIDWRMTRRPILSLQEI